MEKILVVDDDREIALLISDILSDEGYECFLAFNGESTLSFIRNNPDISLILLDIMLPDIDGLEILRQVRDTVDCPILFVTAKNRTYDTMLGFEMGADDYISKPFVAEELAARVKAHLRREKRSLHRKSSAMTIGNIHIDPESYEVTVGTSVLSFRQGNSSCCITFLKMPGGSYRRSRSSAPCGGPNLQISEQLL